MVKDFISIPARLVSVVPARELQLDCALASMESSPGAPVEIQFSKLVEHAGYGMKTGLRARTGLRDAGWITWEVAHDVGNRATGGIYRRRLAPVAS